MTAQEESERLKKFSEDAATLHFKRNAKDRALDISVKINPETSTYDKHNYMQAQPQIHRPTAEKIVNDAEKIYQWLIKEDI